MPKRLLYVELKSGHGDSGPAWISIATTSRTGTTVYSNGRALKRAKGGIISGNHYDLATGEEYWVSGVKKNNQDRHWAGGGDILIDHSAIKTYLKETGRKELPGNLIPTALLPSEQTEAHQAMEQERL